MDPQLKRTLLRAVVPGAIGIGVVVWLFVSDYDPRAWSMLMLNANTVLWLAVALIFVFGRDFGLAWRFRTITDRALSWRRAFRVDIMCAFTSAITPSVVGGSALAIFYLNREGIKVGRATALTLTTLFLDEIFFVVFCPLLALLIPYDQLFDSGQSGLMASIPTLFWLVYTGIVIWTAILFTGILARPQWVATAISRIFRLRWLRRWEEAANGTAQNLLATSHWVKGRSFRWWMEVFGATTLSWFSRYFVVNALFAAFVPASSQLLVFARQFVVWVVLMVSPTPGGTGVSEWLFTNYYGSIIGTVGVALLMATIWRILCYYIYLFVGVIIAPSYFNSKKQCTDTSSSQS